MIKKQHIWGILFITILVILSCTTTDGIVNPDGKTYKIYFTSTGTDGARIFMDHKDTGLKTPALIEDITDETHVFHIFAPDYVPAPNKTDSIKITDFSSYSSDSISIQFELVYQAGGDLIVRSEPDSARVFVNSLEFGETPLKIKGLAAGAHTLKLVKSNYDVVYRDVNIAANDSSTITVQLQEDIRNFAILEHFSNSGCVPCVPVDELVDALSEEYGIDTLIVLGYHAKSPDLNDPMYQTSKTTIDARFNYYNAIYTPRSYVIGNLVSNPQAEDVYRNFIESQLSANVVATIAFQQVNRGATTLTGSVLIKALADFPAGTVAHVLLLEDDVDFETAPGINGLTHFSYVVRDHFENENRINSDLTNGQSKKINFNFQNTSRWGSDLTVVVFLQNTASKAILQAAWTKSPEF